MGLTHYWRRPPRLPQAAFTRAVEDCRRGIPQLGVPLASHTGHAVFQEDLICFNGVAPRHCESFIVRQIEAPQGHRGGGLSFSKASSAARVFSFTKTNLLPYDRCVRVALIILQHHLADLLDVSSDDPGHWDDARAWCQEHLGYGEDFRLSV